MRNDTHGFADNNILSAKSCMLFLLQTLPRILGAGRKLARFIQLKGHTRFDDFIMMARGQIKDHYFLLLPNHFLYRKLGSHNLYRGLIQKLLQSSQKPLKDSSG